MHFSFHHWKTLEISKIGTTQIETKEYSTLTGTLKCYLVKFDSKEIIGTAFKDHKKDHKYSKTRETFTKNMEISISNGLMIILSRKWFIS